MCVLQHPAFKGLAPRVDPGVRVLSAFAASKKSQTPLRLQNNFLLGMEPPTVSTLSMGWPKEKSRWLSLPEELCTLLRATRNYVQT